MKTKRYYYYQFWIQSSRGTDEVIMRRYDKKPSQCKLKEDLENWCERFGAWHVSENHVSYGAKPVVPPKSRKVALVLYQNACRMKKTWRDKCRLYGGFLQYL